MALCALSWCTCRSPIQKAKTTFCFRAQKALKLPPRTLHFPGSSAWYYSKVHSTGAHSAGKFEKKQYLWKRWRHGLVLEQSLVFPPTVRPLRMLAVLVLSSILAWGETPLIPMRSHETIEVFLAPKLRQIWTLREKQIFSTDFKVIFRGSCR